MSMERRGARGVVRGTAFEETTRKWRRVRGDRGGGDEGALQPCRRCRRRPSREPPLMKARRRQQRQQS